MINLYYPYLLEYFISNYFYCQDLESEEKTIAFSKNGEDLETAFTLTGEELEGKALFPHIVVKNAECCLNFGATVSHP